MADKLVLMTGVTGHIGFRTLVEALQAGYRVRAIIRKESSIATVKSAASIKPHLDQLEFAMVGDMGKEGAFDDVVKGVDLVVHIASPLAYPSEDLEKTIIQPAITGTTSILYSALKEPKIKRVVITASQASVLPEDALGSGKVFRPNMRTGDPKGPFTDHFDAYGASKIMAFNASQDFIEKRKPHFTVVSIMPAFVIGRNELATTGEAAMAGTNGIGLSSVMGAQMPGGLVGTSVHVDDVAFLHIASLDPRVEGSCAFAANSQWETGVQFDDAKGIVEKHFPDEVQQGIFPLGGNVPSHKLLFDSSESEKAFDFKFKSFEEQIVSAAGQYAAVVAAPK